MNLGKNSAFQGFNKMAKCCNNLQRQKFPQKELLGNCIKPKGTPTNTLLFSKLNA